MPRRTSQDKADEVEAAVAGLKKFFVVSCDAEGSVWDYVLAENDVKAMEWVGNMRPDLTVECCFDSNGVKAIYANFKKATIRSIRRDMQRMENDRHRNDCEEDPDECDHEAHKRDD